MGVQQLSTQQGTRPSNLLETLSPELAKDLGDAFSLARIGSGPARDPGRGSESTTRGLLRFASRVAVFLLIAVVAISLSAGAIYLMPLR